MIIAKFGGTSVSTPATIRTICEIAKKEKQVLVVSAVAGVTNLLLSLPAAPAKERADILEKIHEIHETLINGCFSTEIREQILAYVDNQLSEVLKIVKKGKNDKETLDLIASYGELMSSYIIAYALNEFDVSARQILATNLIVTNDNFGSAEFLPTPTKLRTQKSLLPLLNKGIVPVVTGFIAKTQRGKTTTLGRGGSDYTASILGFCLGASEIQIWTDVDGIFTADPRIIKDVRLIKTISFKEASELATFGARVLHPRTIKPAIKAGIPVRVLNTFNPNGDGTLIVARPQLAHPPRAVAFQKNIMLVNILSQGMLLQKGFLARVFEIFARHGISVDLVSVSEVSVSLTLDNENMLQKVVEELKKFSSVSVERDLGVISMIGENIARSPRVMRDIFEGLQRKKIKVRMVSLGATDINISLVI